LRRFEAILPPVCQLVLVRAASSDFTVVAAMAGEFANKIHAKSLVLNHFGATIDNDNTEEYNFGAVANFAQGHFKGPVFASQDQNWFDIAPHT